MVPWRDKHEPVLRKRKGFQFFGRVDLIADDADPREISGHGAHDVAAEMLLQIDVDQRMLRLRDRIWSGANPKPADAPPMADAGMARPAGLRGLDLSGFDLSQADLRQADLRGTNLSQANLSRAHLDGANFFKAVLDGANLAAAFLTGAQFLNCAQLVVTRNWQSAFRDNALACGASIPDGQRSE
jgi:uncharacterized protein YjbI with pentapeptide repeats